MKPENKKICAIHQPNFFPWLGYFDKIVRSDVFVLLDNVQLPKTGGGWVNRVQISVGGKAHWISAPLNRAYHGTRLISEITFSDREPRWRDKVCKTISAQYAKANHFKEISEWLYPLIMNDERFLGEYNIIAIQELCARLGIADKKLVRAGDLTAVGSSTDLLVSILRAVGSNAYLCGGGAGGYQEDDKFQAHGIELIYQGFSHPQYKQFKGAEFQGGLSIIDALMHVGVVGVRKILGLVE